MASVWFSLPFSRYWTGHLLLGSLAPWLPHRRKLGLCCSPSIFLGLSVHYQFVEAFFILPIYPPIKKLISYSVVWTHLKVVRAWLWWLFSFFCTPRWFSLKAISLLLLFPHSFRPSFYATQEEFSGLIDSLLIPWPVHQKIFHSE